MEELKFENNQKELTVYIVRILFSAVAIFHMVLLIVENNSSLTGILAIFGFVLIYHELKNRLPSILSRVRKSSCHLTFEYTGPVGSVMTVDVPLDGTIRLKRSLITNSISITSDKMQIRLPWPVSNTELSKIQEFIASNP